MSEQLLTENAITEIEALHGKASVLIEDDTDPNIAALIYHVPALCQTVRAAWARYDAEDKDHRLTIDTFRQQERIWQQKFDEQEQENTALREQLVEAERQRDMARREVRALSGDMLGGL